MTDKPTAVYIYDDLHPQDVAMVQALYSRSPASVVEHVEKVRELGSNKFMGTYYVGYGHESIGDCGTTTIFVENVSMLVAKAIQDTPLYSGQEASTRYLDFSAQPMIDPYSHPAAARIQQDWMTLYNGTMPVLVEAIKQKHPFDPAAYKTEAVWEKGAQVRAFDILRSVLPVGTTTLLSWHTNLRQARAHLRHLRSHPLAEVRSVAGRIYDGLLDKYRESFSGDEMNPNSARYAERNAYAEANAVADHVLTVEAALADLDANDRTRLTRGEMIVDDSLIAIERINSRESVALDRPRGALLHRRLTKYGNYNFKFLIDFGSYRDLQRHRNGYCPVPLIGNHFGFYSWYDDELQRLLPPSSYRDFKTTLQAQFDAITVLPQQGVTTDPFRDQYLYPMGMACATELSYSLPQTVYVAELRSMGTVHATLRPRAQQMGRVLEKNHPLLKLYIDYSEDSWSPKRGEQDIVARPAKPAVA